MLKKLLLAATVATATITAARADNNVRALPVNSPDSLAVAATTSEAINEATIQEVVLEAKKIGRKFKDFDSEKWDKVLEAPRAYQTRRQKYDRGLAFDTKTPSMPKGLWVAGLNVGYSQLDSEAYRVLIVKKLDAAGHSLNVSPMVHYVFAHNQSLGIRFGYKRNWIKIDNLSLNVTNELNSMLFPDGHLKYQYLNHTYMAYLSYRYYVGFGSSVKRILFFNEVQAGFGGGQQRELVGEPPANSTQEYARGTFQNSFNFRIGLSPGIAFFVTNVMAIEVQVDMIGYEFKRLNQKSTNSDQSTGAPEYVTGSSNNSSISSNFDFLSVKFGTTFYL